MSVTFSFAMPHLARFLEYNSLLVSCSASVCASLQPHHMQCMLRQGADGVDTNLNIVSFSLSSPIGSMRCLTIALRVVAPALVDVRRIQGTVLG